MYVYIYICIFMCVCVYLSIYLIPQGAHPLGLLNVCNRSWHLPGNPKLVWILCI